MTTALKEIVGELSGLSAEKQKLAASVIHALWQEEQGLGQDQTVHPDWEAELDRRSAQIRNGEVELIDESSQARLVDDLLQDEA